MRGDPADRSAPSGPDGWLDLSTTVARTAWDGVPAPDGVSSLTKIAADRYGCGPDQVLPVPDMPSATAAILAHLTPRDTRALGAAPPGLDRVATPGADLAALEGADLAVLANPDPVNGQDWPRNTVMRLAARVRHLLIDERLTDPRPDLSMVPARLPNILILRGIRDFWGLTDATLGFVIASRDLLAGIATLLPVVPTPAAAIAAGALTDRDWIDAHSSYLTEAVLRLDRVAVRAGWTPLGGTHLARLYAVRNAAAAQDQLARARVLCHRPAGSQHVLRLGVPSNGPEWDHLARALKRP